MRWWIKFVVALLLIALLLFVGWNLLQTLGNVIQNADTGDGTPDPMFAQPSDPPPTRPPELDAETPQKEHPTLDDYVPEVESPVTMTVDELIREAEAQRQDDT